MSLKKRSGYWLDATNKDAFDRKAPNGLGGRQALLLMEKSRLVTIPLPQAKDHALKSVVKFTFIMMVPHRLA